MCLGHMVLFLPIEHDFIDHCISPGQLSSSRHYFGRSATGPAWQEYEWVRACLEAARGVLRRSPMLVVALIAIVG